MSANTLKIEKKLQSLQAQKAKEEDKLRNNIAKLTEKYNEDAKNLKAVFESKVAKAKEESNAIISNITPEISFYEKKKADLEKLEAQMAALQGDVDARMTNKSKEKTEE